MRRALLPAVLVATIALASVGSAATRSFTKTAWAAYHAVQKGDWNAFSKLCEKEIVIAEYWRDYERKDPASWLMLSKAYASDLVDCERVVTMVIHTKQAPKKEVLAAFTRLSKLIRTMNKESKDLRVTDGLNQVSQESASCGPAIEANVFSDRAWRIELSRNSGSWKVTRLVTIGH